MDTRSRFTVQKLVVKCVRGGERFASRGGRRQPDLRNSPWGRIWARDRARRRHWVGVIVAPVSPFVARWTEQLTCAAFGVILFLVGFALRALRYWATLVNLDIR